MKGAIEFEILDLFLQLDDFLESCRRGVHLRTPHVTIYVRRSDPRNCLDLVDITVAEEWWGQGIMRRFVEYAGQVCPYRFMRIENALNPIVDGYALRHGWHKDGANYWKKVRAK